MFFNSVSEDGLQQQLVGSMQLPVQDKTPQKEVEVVSKEQVNKGQLKQLKVSEEDPSVPTKVDQQGLPKNVSQRPASMYACKAAILVIN